jgi:hypothetical protein
MGYEGTIGGTIKEEDDYGRRTKRKEAVKL